MLNIKVSKLDFWMAIKIAESAQKIRVGGVGRNTGTFFLGQTKMGTKQSSRYKELSIIQNVLVFSGFSTKIYVVDTR